MKWRGWLEWKSITHYAGLSMNEIHWMEAAVNKLTSLLHSIPQIKSKTFNLISLNSRSFVNLMELNCIITVWVILWIWYKDKIIDGINLLMESIMNYLYEYEKYYRRSPSATQINSFLLFENGKKRLIWFAAGSAALCVLRMKKKWNFFGMNNEEEVVGWFVFIFLVGYRLAGQPMAPPRREDKPKPTN